MRAETMKQGGLTVLSVYIQKGNRLPGSLLKILYAISGRKITLRNIS